MQVIQKKMSWSDSTKFMPRAKCDDKDGSLFSWKAEESRVNG